MLNNILKLAFRLPTTPIETNPASSNGHIVPLRLGYFIHHRVIQQASSIIRPGYIVTIRLHCHKILSQSENTGKNLSKTLHRLY